MGLISPDNAFSATSGQGTQNQRELDVLVKIAEILTQPIGLDLKCNQMLEVLTKTAGADRAALRTVNQEGDGLDLMAHYPSDQVIVSRTPVITLNLSRVDCPMIEAFSTHQVLVIDDSSTLESPLPEYYPPVATSLLVCPVQVGAAITGVLGFISSKRNNFGPETVRLLTAITSTIGVLIENATLLEERLQGDEKIIRLAQALEFTDDAIALFDARGDLEYMNKAAQEFGETLSFSPPDHQPSLPVYSDEEPTTPSGVHLTPALEESWSREIRQLDKAGEKMEISISINDVIDNGSRMVGRITVGRDVTENRQMQRDLLALNREREVESNIAKIVSSPLEMSDVFDRFSKEFANLISFDRLSISGVDLVEQVFTENFLYQPGERSYHLKPGDSYHGTVAGAAVESGRCVVFNTEDSDWQQDLFKSVSPLIGIGINSFMGVPLVSQDRIVGALAVARDGGPYTEQDQERATRIGNLISGALAGYILERAKQRAEAEAAENEARFRQIAENIRGGFYLIKLQPHEVLYISPSTGELWGLSAEDLYQGWSQFRRIVHVDDIERAEAAMHLSWTTGELDIEFRVTLEDGSERWIANRGFPIRDESGELYRMGGFLEDITEKKEADTRLAESERLASIGELSAGVAHEINNPLTSIILYSQMLLDEDVPESIRNDLQVVSSQAYRAAKIVRNLLQFARKSNPEKRPLSIGGLIRRSLEMKSHEFAINSINVIDDIPDDLPPIMMDEHLILQVLLNILTNAEQACASAYGRGSITISASIRSSLVDISIQDDGPGISPEQLAKIFEPFFTTKETGFGTGLGLSVSHGILSQHQGKIWAESELGVGTTMHVELPLTTDAGSKALTLISQPDSGSTTSQSTSHLLVVDDEPDLRAILVKQFELRRYYVDQAGDGEEAWRKLQTMDYNCVLLDLRMPGMSGKEFYEKLQDESPELISSIIFITGDTVNPETESFLSSVANPVLSKPFDFRELEQMVVSVINGEKRDEYIETGRLQPDVPSAKS